MTTPPAQIDHGGPAFLGEILGLDGGVLYGWACAASPSNPLILEVLVDGVATTTTIANLGSAGLTGKKLPNEQCCFAVEVPQAELRMAQHIEVRVANTAAYLGGAVRLLEAPKYRWVYPILGEVFTDGGLRFWGWALDPKTPLRAQEIVIYCDGVEVARNRTSEHVPHLTTTGLGTSLHGFSFTLPMANADGRTHRVIVQTAEGVNIPGSPFEVQPQLGGLTTLTKRIHAQLDDVTARRVEPEFALLAQLAMFYEQRISQEVGLEHYRDWYPLYAKSVPKPRPGSSAEIAIVIWGQGDTQRTWSSLSRQSHKHWRAWVIAEDGIEGKGNRFNLSATFADALASAKASGAQAIAIIEAGDHLPEHALSLALDCLEDPSVVAVYGDHDHDDAEGKRSTPWFKPGWDPDYLLGLDYLVGLAVVRSEAVTAPAADPYEFTWQWVEDAQAASATIRHLPHILCHRASGRDALAYHSHLRFQAARTHLKRVSPDAILIEPNGQEGLRQLIWPLPETPLVSLIVPTRDQPELLKACIESLLSTDYSAVEIIIVDNGSRDRKARQLLQGYQDAGITVLKWPQPFNYSAINNYAVQHATGEIIGLINNDIEAIEPGWLSEMVSWLLRPGVGMVGAKLLWPNEMVQHGGVLLGMHGLAGHIGAQWSDHDAGYMGINQVARQTSAVTAACLVVRREDYLQVGGLDADRLPVNFNDVDLCLRLRELGKRVIWTPRARLIHAESASRGLDDTPAKSARAQRERQMLESKWPGRFRDDPHYSPQLGRYATTHNSIRIDIMYASGSEPDRQKND